jgi:aldehyde dehydrogenase (NAD+)
METTIFSAPSYDLVSNAYHSKRAFFDSGATRSYAFRQKQLKNLLQAIRDRESQILSALYKDLGKSDFEGYTSEVGILYAELKHTLKHLKSWMQDERRSTPIFMQPSRSRVVSEPKGVVLIIGPWNYPFQLVIAPLIGAIAAGNCAVVKPSNESYHTSLIVEDLLKDTFDEQFISVVQGPGRTTGPLLMEDFRYDHIFFTGSPGVGKEVAKMAAPHLTPVTLELGGKSPAIIDRNVNLSVAAKRATWGKFYNCGQTCVAPDHVWVHVSVKDKFIELVQQNIESFYSKNARNSENYGRIINEKRMYALSQLLEGQKVIYGGDYDVDARYFAPTLVMDPDMESVLMKEEIFGPIWPINTWEEESDLYNQLQKNKYPLAAYIFSQDKSFSNRIIENFQFGGGAINNTIIHLANPQLPFGGVGTSGMGNYHGKDSFDTFSHQKSILDSDTWVDPSIKYPPYTHRKMKWIKKLL